MRLIAPILFAAALLLPSWSLFAQGFVNTYGAPLADEGVGAVPFGSGFLIATRRYIDAAAGHRAELLGLTPSGSLTTWEPMDGLDGRSFMQAMAGSPDGGALLAGSVIPPGASHHDGFVAKIDADGGLLWLTRPGLTGDEQYFAVHALPDGGCIAAGVRSMGDGHDAWITRFNAFGLVVWHQAIDDFADVEAHAIAVQGDVVMLAGRQLNFGGSTDAWIARLSLGGDVVWTSSWGGVRNETGRALLRIGTDAFLLAGTTNSEVPYDITEARYKDHLYLVAIDLNGDSLWTRAVGDTLFDRRGYGMDIAPNGDLLIAGERSASVGASDAYACRLTQSGAVVWQRTWDLGDEDRLLAIRALPDGLIASGWSFGEASRQVLVVRRDLNGN